MSSVQNKLILINSTFIDKNKKEQKWALRFQESKSSSKTLTVSQGLSNNYQFASTGFALGALDYLWFLHRDLCGLVSEKELQKLYKNFSKIDKDKSGTLEPQEFFDIPGKDFHRFSWILA